MAMTIPKDLYGAYYDQALQQQSMSLQDYERLMRGQQNSTPPVPPDKGDEFNLVLLTGDDDEA